MANDEPVTKHEARRSGPIAPFRALSFEIPSTFIIRHSSFLPPPPPAVVTLDPTLRVSPLATGWHRAIHRPIEVPVRTTPIDQHACRVISVGIGRPQIAARSFRFAEPEAGALKTSEVSKTSEDCLAMKAHGLQPVGFESTKTAGAGRSIAGQIRIRPPDDVVKLDDRLRYVLQPSLESLLSSRSLGFPLRPFPYQLEGVAFLYPRQAAILADEMGLGKTMQAITAVRLLLHGGEIRSVLLICPKPLVSNWHREFSQWAPEIPVMVIEGDPARRRWQWQLPSVPVRIANYELLHRDGELLDACAANGTPCARFDLVVLDEAQRIKNASSITNQAVRAIPRDRSWALTGTPVENGPQDLVGIFEFLAPGFLSPDVKPGRIGRTIRDYVLRRTKERVLADLPPRLFCDAELDLTPQQRETYELARDEGVLRLTEMGQSATIRHVFELVLRLKQICNFDPATGASAKLERLEADLEEVVQSGRKAIVFSQWVQTLQRLSGVLRRFRPLEYHGRIPAGRREAVVRRFREDPSHPLLLISYGAGGVGLNLQAAGYVFLFDRWWNPAVEDQAIHRAHRIGVAGPVTVVRFLMLDTIEERIDRILQQKRDLRDTIFSGVDGPRRLGLTQEELFGLFDLRGPGGSANLAA
jgi:SNF2 family DNA or RNA helicase